MSIYRCLASLMMSLFLFVSVNAFASSGVEIPWPSNKVLGEFSRYVTENHKADLIRESLEKKYISGGSYPVDIVYRHDYIMAARDGAVVRYSDVAYRISTPLAKELLGEQTFQFNSTEQTIDFICVEVYLSDGKKVVTDPAVSSHVKEPFTGLVYSDLKVKTLTVKGLEEGSVLRIIVKSTYKPKIMKDFVLLEIECDSPVPVKDKVSILRFEKGMQMVEKDRLNWPVSKITRRKYTEKEGAVFHLFRITDIVPRIVEPRSVPTSEIDNRIVFFSHAQWKDIIKFCAGLFEPKISAGKELYGKTRELTGHLTNRDDKIRALYDYVKGIRYVSISLNEYSYVPRFADETFRNKYGDCKDKSVLLLAMLRSIGIDGNIALVRTLSLIDNDVASPFHFDHAIVVVKEDGGSYSFLDPSAPSTPYGLLPSGEQVRHALILGDGTQELVMVPQQVPQKNQVEEIIDVEIKDLQTATVSGRSSVITANPFQHALPTLPLPMIKRVVQEIIGSQYRDFEIVSLRFDQADSLGILRGEYKLKINDFTRRIGNSYVFNPLVRAGEMELSNAVALRSRTTDMELDAPGSADITVTYRIPDSVMVEFVPKTFAVKNDKFGSYIYEVTRSSGIVRVKRKMQLTARRISAKDYNEFRDFYRACLRQDEEMVGLRAR